MASLASFATREEYNEYMRLYMKRRYDERMAMAREYLGGVCVECNGFSGDDRLEIDHIDPATKCFTLATGTTKGLAKFMVELDKCQLLCKTCHSAKSGREQSVEHGGGVSGKKNCFCDPCKAKKRQYYSTKGYGLRRDRISH